jgi:hypothetical protein
MGYSIKDLEDSSKQKPVVSAPAAKAKGSKPVAKETTPTDESNLPRDNDDPNFQVLSETIVDDQPFDLISFMRASPIDPLTDASDVGDATLVLKQTQLALKRGGITTTVQMPMAAKISNVQQFDAYLAGIDSVVTEIKAACIKISNSVKAAVHAKQKETGKKQTDPKRRGQGEVYPHEWTFWQGPLRSAAAAAKAEEIIGRKLSSLVKGDAKSLLAFLKKNTNITNAFAALNLDEEKAAQIGRLILEQGSGNFPSRIDESNTGNYYSFNQDMTVLKGELQALMADSALKTAILKVIKDE